MRKETLFIFVFICVFASVAYAAERMEELDENKDGRKEAKMFYDEQGNKIHGEVDMNGDGISDRFVKFKNGKRFTAESDTNFDGKIDAWEVYDEKGVLKRRAKDSNKDGKPDQFYEMLKGKNLLMKEYDRNYDGKIDKRQLVEWGMIKYGPKTTPIPGYKTVWKEEDNNFDGKIDVYREKGNKEAAKKKIGKPIDTLTRAQVEATKPPEPSPSPTPQGRIKYGKSWWEDRIKKLNERFGYKE